MKLSISGVLSPSLARETSSHLDITRLCSSQDLNSNVIDDLWWPSGLQSIAITKCKRSGSTEAVPPAPALSRRREYDYLSTSRALNHAFHMSIHSFRPAIAKKLINLCIHSQHVSYLIITTLQPSRWHSCFPLSPLQPLWLLLSRRHRTRPSWTQHL